MEIPILTPETKMMYRSDPYRFVVLAIFCIYCLFIGLFMNPYAPIADCLNIAYKVSIPQIISTMICFLVGKIVSAPISGLLLEQVGLKPGIYVALVIMTFGLFLRTQLELSFALVLIAQFLLGLSAAIIVSCQMKFLYEWHHPNTRGYFTTIVSFSFIIGGGLGLVFILFFVTDSETDPDIIKDQLGRFDKAHLIIVLILAIVHTVFFLSRPRKEYGYQPIQPGIAIPESEVVAATEAPEGASLTARQQLSRLFAQPAFRLFLTLYVLVNGVNLLNSSVLTIVYSEFGIQSFKKGLLVGLALCSGVAGSVFFIHTYLPTPENRTYFTRSLILSVCFGVFNIICFLTQMPYLILVLAQCGFGATFFMGLPVTIEYLLRNVKEVPLTFVNGLIFFFGQGFACLLLLINRGIFEWLKDKPRHAIYMSWGLSCVVQFGLVFLSRVRPDIGSNLSKTDANSIGS